MLYKKLLADLTQHWPIADLTESHALDLHEPPYVSWASSPRVAAAHRTLATKRPHLQAQHSTDPPAALGHSPRQPQALHADCSPHLGRAGAHDLWPAGPQALVPGWWQMWVSAPGAHARWTQMSCRMLPEPLKAAAAQPLPTPRGTCPWHQTRHATGAPSRLRGR